MKEQGKRKVICGAVISNKMDKTVVVGVTTSYRHPLYKKIVKRDKKYYAHDENNSCQLGQTVKIIETRPLSKLKRWRIVEAKKNDSTSK